MGKLHATTNRNDVNAGRIGQVEASSIALGLRKGACLENQRTTTGKNYHLLSGTLGQGVAVPQVIDLNVLDIVSIRDVYFRVRFPGAIQVRRGFGFQARACGLSRISQTPAEPAAIQFVFTDRIGGTSTC